MKAEEIENKINEILAMQLGYCPEEIEPQLDFRNNLGADLLDEVEILIEMENVFDCNLENELINNCNSVSDIYQVVKTALQNL